MSPSLTLETPIIENKPFLLRDPMMIEDANFLKDQEDDDFSTDSWERVSNEELDDIVQISNSIINSPIPSPAPSQSLSPSSTADNDLDADTAMSVKSESSDSTTALMTSVSLTALGSPPVLIKMDDNETSTTSMSKKQKDLNDTPETRTMKRERNRLAARRCRQKQKDRIDYLERDVKDIETENYKVENEIKLLRQQLKELHNALENHDCMFKQAITPRQHYYSMKF